MIDYFHENFYQFRMRFFFSIILIFLNVIRFGKTDEYHVKFPLKIYMHFK